MCIRDRYKESDFDFLSRLMEREGIYYYFEQGESSEKLIISCLLYTSDAADERSSVDLGGRRIIKKKNSYNYVSRRSIN